jgi:hypothetical protein
VVVVGDREADLQILDADECYRLLATQQIGRLGVNAEHYPLIFPVNYAIDRDVIVIRTGAAQSCLPPTTRTSRSRSTRSTREPAPAGASSCGASRRR